MSLSRIQSFVIILIVLVQRTKCELNGTSGDKSDPRFVPPPPPFAPPVRITSQSPCNLKYFKWFYFSASLSCQCRNWYLSGNRSACSASRSKRIRLLQLRSQLQHAKHSQWLHSRATCQSNYFKISKLASKLVKKHFSAQTPKSLPVSWSNERWNCLRCRRKKTGRRFRRQWWRNNYVDPRRTWTDEEKLERRQDGVYT